MDDLGLAEGDVIEIVGKRSTPARAIGPYGEDEGLDIIRLDGLQRANAGIGSGDFVEVRKAESKPATRVVFAPPRPIPPAGFRRCAEAQLRRPAADEGDTVATVGHQRVNADMPDHIRQMLNAPGFALQELRLVVAATRPRASSTSTARRRSSCFPNIPRGRTRRADVTYDDLGGMRDTIDALREMVELPLRHPELFQRSVSIRPRAFCCTARQAPGRPCWRAPSPTRARRSSSTSRGRRSWARPMARASGGCARSSSRRRRPRLDHLYRRDRFDRTEARSGERRSREASRCPLLTLLDGMEPRQNTVIIAATNRPEALDEALRRPGRLTARSSSACPISPEGGDPRHPHSRNAARARRQSG